MRSQHLSMPIDQFNTMPRNIGWRYEYFDNQAHITPSCKIATTVIDVKSHNVDYPYTLQSVKGEDQSKLISAFIEFFEDTIEYCDWDKEKIAESASESIQGYFSGKWGKPLSNSCVALVNQFNKNIIVGTALLVESDNGPLLKILFVIPSWQRKKVATALISTALNELHKNRFKSLTSHYVLGNSAAKSWYKYLGFKEIPDLFIAKIYLYHAIHELDRREGLGDLSEFEYKKLFSEVEKWKVEVEKLENIAERYGLKAVLPCLD